jgi:hypothetical protein
MASPIESGSMAPAFQSENILNYYAERDTIFLRAIYYLL